MQLTSVGLVVLSKSTTSAPTNDAMDDVWNIPEVTLTRGYAVPQSTRAHPSHGHYHSPHLSSAIYRWRHLEPFSGVEIHMEMDMDWKWMEMGHILRKCYGLVWIWGRPSTLNDMIDTESS